MRSGPRTLPKRVLFVATILTGSFLLFLVQPMVARMALPRLGGASAVWNSAMLVYQALLLGGYAYAHALSRMPIRRQVAVHIALLLVARLTLPVVLVALPPPSPGTEVLWVPLLLILSIGPTFFAVSAQAPLMQRWFAADAQAGAPWALYAASNLGSFSGLIAYPLFAEPLMSLNQQGWAWTLGYAVLIGLVALCAWARWDAADQPRADLTQAPPVARKTILLWLALAAVPSGLMLSTTTHLTTDLFAMPMLWVLPLGLYLLSFVAAFAERRGPANLLSVLAWLAMLTAGGMAMVSRGSSGLAPVLASLLLLFLICVALHARLYDLRPAPERLTLFYLTMSGGGALGGLFTALVAPALFDWVWEHPLLVLAAALLLPRAGPLDWRRMPGLEPDMARVGMVTLAATAAFCLWRLYDTNTHVDAGVYRWAWAGGAALLGLALVPWRGLCAALVLTLMLVQGGFETIGNSLDHIRSRSYYGVYTVRDYPTLKVRSLAHGTTIHGEQSTDPALATTPLTYYGPGAGAGIVFGNGSALFPGGPRVGVLGLGVGTLACFNRPGWAMTFYEIDPLVLRLSRDGTFTYLQLCAPHAPVVIGDARLAISSAPPASFDLLAIDAFSSDSVPLHLFTHEAFGTYLRALSPHGVMMVNISNRFIELEPPLAAEIRSRHLFALVRDDTPQGETELTASTWVAVSRDAVQLRRIAALAPGKDWRNLAAPAPGVWTDDHASILPYVRWHNFMGTRQ
ncbi:MAG: fused MFS/spermidine synthase [Novosphingobium sp.]